MGGKDITVNTDKLGSQIEQLQEARNDMSTTLNFTYTNASDCSGLAYDELVKLQAASKDVVASLEKLYDSTISFMETIKTNAEAVDSAIAGELGEG